MLPLRQYSSSLFAWFLQTHLGQILCKWCNYVFKRQEARELLRRWREDTVRRSEEVVEIWEDFLKDYMHKLGEEEWLVYEQICIAALDCAREDVADECLECLEKQFPDSLRVRKLQAMKQEYLESYDEAIKNYECILQLDEANSVARKRLIAICKAQNKIPEAIKELNEYLKKFMGDYEAWMELCDLYILELDYAKAAFCMEELLMSNPHNHLYHQRYAEIRYTQGGFENMELARTYFAQAVKLNNCNLRALFGLRQSANNLASLPKCNTQKRTENIKYVKWAEVQICEKYQAQISKEQAASRDDFAGFLKDICFHLKTLHLPSTEKGENQNLNSK